MRLVIYLEREPLCSFVQVADVLGVAGPVLSPSSCKKSSAMSAGVTNGPRGHVRRPLAYPLRAEGLVQHHERSKSARFKLQLDAESARDKRRLTADLSCYIRCVSKLLIRCRPI